MVPLTTAADPARFDCLAEDIALCRATMGRIDVRTLLGRGWRMVDLLACEDFEARAAACAYEKQLAANEGATIAALILALAGSILILTYGLFGTALRGLA